MDVTKFTSTNNTNSEATIKSFVDFLLKQDAKVTNLRADVDHIIQQKACSAPAVKDPPDATTKPPFVPPHLRMLNEGKADDKKKDASDNLKAIKLEENEANMPVLKHGPQTASTQTQPIIDCETNTAKWAPVFVRKLPPLAAALSSPIPHSSDMQTFSKAFLHQFFGGVQFSYGLYYVPAHHGECLSPSRSWYTLDPAVDPFVPTHPGLHGAKLVPFFPDNPIDDGLDVDIYANAPVFVARSKSTSNKGHDEDFIYVGNYTQSRWSDKLDHDTMSEHVPPNVKEYWAKKLSEADRPIWVTEALVNHFFPKPEYKSLALAQTLNGHRDMEMDAEHEEVSPDVEAYMDALQQWERKVSGSIVKRGVVSEEALLDAFNRAESDDPAGLRLQWEYLECVGWDAKLYRTMVHEQEKLTKPNKAQMPSTEIGVFS